jgi:hypothetical protein
MAERMDLVTPRQDKNGKTWWTRIGVAWAMNGGGWRLNFEALPIPSKNRDGDYEVMVLMRAPFDRDGDRRSSQSVTSGPRSTHEDEDIPF